jgi:hypothetical protein
MSFSCFARQDSFSAVPIASGPVFMFCTPGLVFDGTKGVGSCFHVLRAQTHFQRYRGRRIQFSCFALPDSFSAVPMASGPVFMICAPGLVFGGTEGVWFRFQVLHSQTHFRRYRGRRVPFSCFALLDFFSAIPRASGPVFMFCARTRFWRYRGRRVPFSYFACSNSFSAVSCASVPVFMFCSRTHFRRYRGHQDPFSCFALPDSFSTISRASGPVFMISAHILVFGGTEGVGTRFHVLPARARFRLIDGVGSRFQVLRSRTHFRRYRGRPVPFSCFATPDSYSAVRRASVPDLMFCTSGLIFGGTDGVVSRFHILCRVPTSCFARQFSSSAVPRALGPVFMFCSPDSFSAVPRALGPIFMFCSPD